MPSLNRVMLIGNLTREPEVRYTPKGTAVVDIGMAVNRTWTDDSNQKREETTFVDVTFWGRQAETIGQYCRKGSSLYVEGRLQLDTWDDRETGQKRSKLRVIGESFQFLGGKQDAGSNPQGASTQSPRNPPQQAPHNARPENNPRNMGYDLNPDDGDDIPF